MDQEIVVQEPVAKGGSSLAARIGLTVFFVLLGVIFSFGTATMAPRFWYVPTGVFLLLAGGLWFRPRVAASASLPFCLTLTYMMLTIRPWLWDHYELFGVISLVLIVIGTAICLRVVLRSGLDAKAAIVSVVLLMLGLAVDLGFTNRVEERTVEMSWTADGTDPTGDQAELSSTGEKPVILFTPVQGGYCTDTVYSEALRQKLVELHKPRVQVVFNEFRNFGRIYGHNIGSVEGMVFNRGLHVVIPNPEGSQGILTGDPSTQANPNAPSTCPR